MKRKENTHTNQEFNYKSNVQNLETQTRKLRHAKERLQHDVDEELRKVGQKTEADVEEWLTEVNKNIDEAHQFMEDERQANKCLNGFCRYHPSRKAAKLSQKTMVELRKRKEFLRLTYSTPLQDIWTTVGYPAFQSRTSIVTRIFEEFKKDNIDMIGIYGVGGVGKTTLIKQVASKVEEDKLFDNVVKVEVKQNTDVERIQREIAEKFGLQKFDENETVAGRARILSQYIKGKKKILVIFYDVWNELELEKLEVPVGMCKVLVTSRTKEVLFSKMGIETNIQLNVLNEEDTWSLFEKTVGDAVKGPGVGKVAIEVANECKGLPVLVVTVAKALKGRKELHSWADVLGRLKGKQMLETAYSGIKWSYDQLESEGLKSMFLIFGILGGRDHFLQDMLKYTLGLGLSLYEGINAMEDSLTMHDLVCDVARKIASTDQRFLALEYGDLFKEWPIKEFLEKCTTISLQLINIPNLPDELECPRLQLFELHSKDKILLCSKLKQLPKEIGRLTRLRLLDLRGCPKLEVIYPDVMRSLTKLEELNMSSFNKWETEEASNSIGGRSNASFTGLKHLPNLTTCEDLSLDVFEGVNNIIVHLQDKDDFEQLKKLHVQNNPEISHVVHSNIGYSRTHSRTAFPILEALSLYNLVSLESVCSGQLADGSFRQLKIIRVENCPKLKNLFSFSTILHFLQLEEIEVEDCKNMKEIVEGREEQLMDEVNDPFEFHGLRSLTLISLPELISFSSYHSPLIVASTSRNPMQLFNDKVVFPKLEALKLSSIPLNKLWDGQLSARLCWIQNLTSLIIEGCDGLTFLCSSSMSMNLFVQLKTLEIRGCENMVEIILTEEYGEVKNMDNMFPKLEARSS
ncbi:hypothetical protein FNV43_RR08635 [Rhamnella rubrinervis]|uniref:NB-ARC domain-containing protein n=1 Tax=Rhamnella rubrinervis TaxID=2594499 RepID=A0A8K0H9Q8_9ROSA|nr:hypothetical protein FNV43_RR08635 [Rhamnella rubrinervis]